MPFLGILTNPQSVFDHSLTQPLIRTLEVESPKQLAIPITIAFASTAIIAGVTRLALVWATTRWTFTIGAELSTDIYRRTLYQPYLTHISRNSSDVIANISTKIDSVIYQILQLLNLIGAATILVGILATMLIVDPLVSTTAITSLAVIYGSVILTIRRRLHLNSKSIAKESNSVVRSIQEGLGGIRDIIVGGSQEVYCAHYSRAALALRRAQGNNIFLGSSPRYAVEALSMLFIALLAYQLTRESTGVMKSIPTLGLLAIGAQRMLPALQIAYSSWASIRGEMDSLWDIISFLDQKLPVQTEVTNQSSIPFNECIQLIGIAFRHGENPWILREISLRIEKGSRVGFIGVTGSGKSSLLDIIMGLLPATDGQIKIDDELLTSENHRQWHNRIAHVPQNIFLSDTSIEENIAFGIDRQMIDYERVKLAAKQAQIDNFIESLPNRYQTSVGERGIRLSGGQRQRIGIARALYKQADLLILDEATSALDTETEEQVMASIAALNKNLTVLTVAHRLSTLRDCSQIIELKGGIVSKIMTFEQLAPNV